MYESLNWLAPALFLCTAVLWKPSHERARLQTAWAFLSLWLAVWLFSFLPPGWLPEPPVIRGISLALVQLAAVQTAVVIVFDFILRRIHIPKFVSEIVIVGGYLAIVFNLLYKLGVNVTGIFATSAVATAVVGLALQDMLSNIASGIALEFEGGLRPGDYIKCGEWSGWVQHVRLRHTAIRTQDNDTVVLPNSQLTRLPVSIHARAHRQFIPFSMPYTVNPQEVIDTVEFALRSSPLPDIASDPAPCCIVRELGTTGIQYTAIVWLARAGHNVMPMSTVLVRLFFALRRAGIPASELSHLVEMKAAGESAPESKNPVDVLRRTPILRLLDDPDLFELGSCLHHQSFAPGEHIITQGDPGSSMYFVISGGVNIMFRASDGMDRQVSVMEPGDIFGEASLLTGEIRTASAVAHSQVDCYRLDKVGLQGIINRRSDLAEDMSVVMAHRQMELAMVRDRLDEETARRREAEEQTQLLTRIRRFFGITANGARA